MGTSSFWKQSGERAAKTFAQVVVLLIGSSLLTDVAAFDVFTADWPKLLGMGLGGAVLSVLTSVLSAPVSPGGTPSLVEVETGRHARRPPHV